MGIRYSSDSAQLMAKLGQATGQAQAAKEQADRAAAMAARYQQAQQEAKLREQSQAMQMKAQADQAKRVEALQIQEQEGRLRQAEVEAKAKQQLQEQAVQARAEQVAKDDQRGLMLRDAQQDFEMQKIMLRQQQDFELMQYRDGLMKKKEIDHAAMQKDKYQQGIDQIKELKASGELDQYGKSEAQMLAQLKMKFLGFDNVLGGPARQDTTTQLADLLRPKEPSVGTNAPQGKPLDAINMQRIFNMAGKDPQKALELARKEGYSV